MSGSQFIKRFLTAKPVILGIVVAVFNLLSAASIVDIEQSVVESINTILGLVFVLVALFVTPVGNPALPEGTKVTLTNDGTTGTVQKD